MLFLIFFVIPANTFIVILANTFVVILAKARIL